LHAVAKLRLPRLGGHGFRLPRTVIVATLDDPPAAGRAPGVPVAGEGPVADARVVHSDQEARVAGQRLAATWGMPLLAQEYVAGQEVGRAGVAQSRPRAWGE